MSRLILTWFQWHRQKIGSCAAALNEQVWLRLEKINMIVNDELEKCRQNFSRAQTMTQLRWRKTWKIKQLTTNRLMMKISKETSDAAIPSNFLYKGSLDISVPRLTRLTRHCYCNNVLAKWNQVLFFSAIAGTLSAVKKWFLLWLDSFKQDSFSCSLCRDGASKFRSDINKYNSTLNNKFSKVKKMGIRKFYRKFGAHIRIERVQTTTTTKRPLTLKEESYAFRASAIEDVGKQ